MAVGIIKQIQIPATTSSTSISLTNLSSTAFKIGISVDEKDYMLAGSNSTEKSIPFRLNGSDQNHQIWLGKKCMYEVTQPLIAASSEIIFPEGVP